MSSAKTTASDVLVRGWVEVILMKYRFGPRKTLEHAVNAIIAVFGSLADFPVLAADIPVVDNDIVNKNVLWNLYDVTSRNHHRPSVSQRVPMSCKTRSLAVLSFVMSVQ